MRWWSGQLDRFAWAVSYDTLGDPARTARDHDQLLDLPWRWPDDIPVVLVRAYPHHSAADILAEVLGVRHDLDDEEIAQYDRLLAAGELAAHNGRPACAVGCLAVARYARDSAAWYRQLLTDLERAAGSQVDISECRLHLLGIGRPDWDAVRRYYDPAFGLSLAKLRGSRDARLALFLMRYRQIAGQL